MFAALTLLCCLSMGTLQESDIRARFSIEPVEVEVGQPFSLSLNLEHPSDQSVFDIKLEKLLLDDSWVIFDEERETALELAGSPGRSVTRWTWSIASLDAGERRLLNELISLIDDERVALVDASATEVHVLSLLGDGEDAPRPLRGLPAGFGDLAPDELSLWQRTWPGIVAFVVLLSGLWIWRLLRKRQAPVETPYLAPLAELEQLRAEPISEEQALRARHFALTSLVRRALDEKCGSQRSGLTDQEWLIEIEPALQRQESLATLGQDLKDFLEAAESVKYARAGSSEWALEETHASTRKILEELRQAQWVEREAEALSQ